MPPPKPDSVEDFQEIFAEFFRVVPLYSPSTFLMDLELSDPQCAVLDFINKNPGCTMGQLSKGLEAPLSTLTGLVERLVRNGYVLRERDEKDRRLVRIRLTPPGQKTAEEIKKTYVEILRRIYYALSPRDRHSFIRIIKKIVTTFQKVNHGQRRPLQVKD